MAIRYKRTQAQAQAFAMAPMVDMVFLLLVFFMCVTAVSGGRARAKIELPQTATASAASGANSTGKPQIVLSIRDDGALEVNGMACQQADLVPLLRHLRAQAQSAPTVRVRAATNTPYSRIEPVLAACAATGLSTISYAAYEVATVHIVSGAGAAGDSSNGSRAADVSHSTNLLLLAPLGKEGAQ